MTDSSLDRIAAVNPCPDGLGPLPIEAIRRRIAEAERTAPETRRSPRAGFRLAALATLVVTAVVVVVVALTVHGGANGGPTETGAGAGHPVRTRNSRAALVASLAALRRPQTAADRAALVPLRLDGVPIRLVAGGAKIQTSLLRSLRTAAGDRISVVPVSWRPSVGAKRSEGLVIAIHTPDNAQQVNTGPEPVSVAGFEHHGLAVFNDTRRGALVVPDGVARVELDGFGSSAGGQPVTLDSARIAGLSASVHDNLATFTLSGLTASSHEISGLSAGSVAVHMTWFDSAGRVIAHPTTDFGELYFTVRGPKPVRPARTLGSAPLLPSSGSVRFARATGRVVLSRAGFSDVLTFEARGLPDLRRDTYGIWLTGPAGARLFLGYVADAPHDGRISVRARLVDFDDLRRYRAVEVAVTGPLRRFRESKAPRPVLRDPVLAARLP